MKRIILILMLVQFWACIQKLDSDTALKALVQAEQTFAKTSIEQGIRNAFLTYLANDAIVFRPNPMKGKPLYEALKENSGVLSWRPIHAEVAASGDFGYTTGPYEYRKNSESEKPDGCGFYVSVWKKQNDGTWRVIIDAGINCPCSDTTFSEIMLYKQQQKLAYKARSMSDVEIEQTRLMELDFGFASQVEQQGILNAFQTFSADNIRYYRVGELPIVGKESVDKKLKEEIGAMVWKPMASKVAISGDLGYTYGTADFASESSGKKSYAYLRIWKKALDGEWKMVVDLTNPIPEKTYEPNK